MKNDGKQMSFTGDRTGQRYVAPLKHCPTQTTGRGELKRAAWYFLVQPLTLKKPLMPADCFLNRFKIVLFEDGKEGAYILNWDKELY